MRKARPWRCPYLNDCGPGSRWRRC